MRRRKVTYPPPKTATKGPPPVFGAADPRNPANRTISIDLTALAGRASVAPGARVRIMSGLYAGETATVEAMAGGVIPAAVVRTESGQTRRARTVDLEPIRGDEEPAGAPSERDASA